MQKTEGGHSIEWNYLVSFGVFLLLYVVGIIIPLELTPHYHNLMSRVWNWTEILILVLAICYIIKAKRFWWKQAAIAFFLGAVCLVALLRDSRTADIMVTSVCVMVAYYAACVLYDMADMENTSGHLNMIKSIQYFLLGAACSVPLALLNVFYYSFSHEINVRNIAASAIYAIKPAIAEEVVFRFFLLAYAYYLLHGKTEKRSSNVCSYLFMVIPHDLLHYPDLFIKSPGLAIVMCILNGVLFGLPMALLMKKKNLQMAMGMHWFIDFARFATGF